MKDLPTTKGRRYIASLISEGEHLTQDFKYMISDARKIARSISAFANAAGGRLLIGVKDNGTVAGVRNEEDIYVVEQAAERYCDPPQQVEFTAYTVDSGIIVIKAAVSAAPSRPVYAQDTDGKWKAYFRVADENIHAHPLMVRAWKLRETSTSGFSLGERESRLLDALNAHPDGLTPFDLAIALHASQKATDDLIAHMAAVGVLDFRFDGNQFLIIRAEAENPEP